MSRRRQGPYPIGHIINMLIISMMSKPDLSGRFGFLVHDVGRLYARRFDALARQRLGLTRAQCRLLGALSMHEGEPMSQAALAERLELTAMAVAGLCDRMEAAGWIRRQPSATDRRVNEVALQPRARAALDDALKVGDSVTTQAMAGMTDADQRQLLALLRRVHANLARTAEAVTE
jgi:DNA-binding MarR family transcriptional regulator